MSYAETNKLKKGTRILLSNGWLATLEDNKRGAIRLATVEGFYTETGSIYADDIVAFLDKGQGIDIWTKVSKNKSNMIELLSKALHGGNK